MPREVQSPTYVDFFNGGQKLYFWAIVVSAVVFLVTGIPMWFPDGFGRIAVAVSYVLHDIAALVMVGGFIVHLYEGTAAQPGTLRSDDARHRRAALGLDPPSGVVSPGHPGRQPAVRHAARPGARGKAPPADLVKAGLRFGFGSGGPFTNPRRRD